MPITGYGNVTISEKWCYYRTFYSTALTKPNPFMASEKTLEFLSHVRIRHEAIMWRLISLIWCPQSSKARNKIHPNKICNKLVRYYVAVNKKAISPHNGRDVSAAACSWDHALRHHYLHEPRHCFPFIEATKHHTKSICYLLIFLQLFIVLLWLRYPKR